MTELSFLLELLLTHKLQKSTKEALMARIKEIESKQAQSVSNNPGAITYRAPKTAQSPSMQRILDEMANEGMILSNEPQPVPVAIAQTQAVAAALAERRESINIALSGKEEKGRTSPRKF